MTKIENRDPHGVAVTPVHNSGTPRPTPSGPHLDPRAGGQVPPSQYQNNPVPIKNGGQD
jgi:hypothetical protein